MLLPQSAVAWFDMIEYYESTCHLNISFNKNIGVRGWQACSRLIRRVSEHRTKNLCSVLGSFDSWHCVHSVTYSLKGLTYI